MLLVAVGMLLIAGGIGLFRGARRRSVATRRLGSSVAGALALIGVATIGVVGWAHTATGSSQLARTIVWGDSAVGDQDRFPSRTIENGPNVVDFDKVEVSPVPGFRYGDQDLPFADLLAQSETTAFIVLHHDVLLYEEYFNGSGREAVQTSFSVAKSFVATLVGIAIDEGLVDNVDDRVVDYLPELSERDARFDAITLRHLITMSSGLSFEEGSSPWDDPANTYHGTDLRSAALTIPEVLEPPGIVFHYNDWNVILLGLVLERASGMPVADYTSTRLWQPMGAEAAGSWSLDSEDSGLEKMFVGVNARAIDFAKLGWLYLNEGRNGDRQVVPSGFVEEATRLDTSTDPAAEYQYLWWLDEARNAYFAQGDHGQFIYVHPEAGLVITRHGTTPDNVDWVRLMGNLAEWLESQTSAEGSN